MLKSVLERIKDILEKIMPGFIRLPLKRVFWFVVRYYNKKVFIKKGKHVEFGYWFRFSRIKPYEAIVGENTVTDEFNVWNAKGGDIIVGKRCWFGLHNIVMGPVDIGNNVSTGPHVSILGPSHPALGRDENKREKTVIGDNVTLATGSIILFGVSIGDNAIVSAGSVVSKDVAPNSFVAGNPARDITKLISIAWEKGVEENRI